MRIPAVIPRTRPLLAALLAALSLAAAGADAPVPYFDTRSYNVWVLSSLAHDTEARKLYVGMRARDQKALAVFDTDAQGAVTGDCRRYAVYPESIPSGNVAIVQCLLLDKPRHQLFLGLGFATTALPNPIITLPLDAQGEPAGPPRSFAMGNPMNSCQDLALHPFTNRLYAVGWGGVGLYALDLDATGAPTGAPHVFPAGSYGKYSVSLSSNASQAYLGTYPSVLEVCDLNPSGDLVNAVRRYPVTNGPNVYLVTRAAGRSVYFRNDQDRLAHFPLNSQGEPDGTVAVDSNRFIQAFALSPTGSLVLAEAGAFSDAITGQPRTNGFRIREYGLASSGGVESLLRDGPLQPRVKATVLTARPATAAAIAGVSGFAGNTWSGLVMRIGLLDVVPAATLAPSPRKVPLGVQAKYLTFVYDPGRDTLYAAGTNALYAYSPAGTGALAAVDSISNSGPVAVDGELGLLYATRSGGVLEIRALDPAGAITGAPFCVASGIGTIRALCLNPVSHHLYIFGSGGPAGVITNPVNPLVQRLVRVPTGIYFDEAAVDPARSRLYGADSYNTKSNILVWTLNPDGTVSNATPRKYDEVIPQGTNPVRIVVTSLLVDADHRRLIYGGMPESGSDTKGWIGVYDLDSQGEPTGTPLMLLSSNSGKSTLCMVMAPSSNLLYESGQGSAFLFGRQLGPDGAPSSNVVSWSCGSYGKSQLALSADSRSLLAGTYPSMLEIIPLQTNGLPAEGATVAFTLGSLSTNLGYLAENGDSSAWLALDAGLTNATGLAEGTFTFSGGTFASARFIVELVWNTEAGPVTLTNLEIRLDGNTATLMMPRYGADPNQTNGLAGQIEDADALFARYLSSAEACAVAPVDRPRRFIISNGLIGLGSGLRSVQDGIRAAAAVGHNTLQIWNFSPTVSPEAIRAAAVSNGITGYRLAVYNPPSYFDYNTNLVDPAYLDAWADSFKPALAAMGGQTNEVLDFKIADEPGWYYPYRLQEVATNASRLAVFRDFLSEKGFAPDTFGQPAWSNVFPMPLSGATNLPSKRLLFWTARFYTESLGRSFAAATEALQRRFQPRLFTAANFNNWPGRFFVPSPNAKIANNPDVGPDSAMGMPDWFDLARKRGVSCLWTEDWFGDRSAQQWSYYTDLLRCAARESGIEYGAYVVGLTTGGMKDGGAYKILSLIGHGAKVIDPYIFASYYAFANCWSESPAAYRSLADGLRLVGRAERLLYPGRPRTGTVALLLPQASQVWETNSTLKLNLSELSGLHAGLIHSQYPVDIVDDIDLENGLLASNRYAALYITAPNLSTNAQRAVLDWVGAGGTLALLPGSCGADEYNEPAPGITSVMGCAWGEVPRVMAPTTGFVTQAVVAVQDGRIGVASDLSRAQTAPLMVTDGTELARFADGSAALVEKGIGSGRILSFGYWPGTSYVLGRDDFDLTRLPRDWPAATRALLTAPARLAKAGKFVTVSADGVEAALLESSAGVAVTLLNWFGDPLAAVTVTVPMSPDMNRAARHGVLRVESAVSGPLTPIVQGGQLSITLPLAAVDVVSIATPNPGALLLIR